MSMPKDDMSHIWRKHDTQHAMINAVIKNSFQNAHGGIHVLQLATVQKHLQHTCLIKENSTECSHHQEVISLLVVVVAFTENVFKNVLVVVRELQLQLL